MPSLSACIIFHGITSGHHVSRSQAQGTGSAETKTWYVTAVEAESIGEEIGEAETFNTPSGIFRGLSHRIRKGL
jgi:hypothetical protein